MAKGPQWERDFCTRLSLWWTEGKDDTIFWRTQGSGGRATSRKKKGKKLDGQYGDVAATGIEGQELIRLVHIELKRGYSSRSIADLLDQTKSAGGKEYEQWLDKIYTCCKDTSTPYWWLVVRRNKRVPIAIMPLDFYKAAYLTIEQQLRLRVEKHGTIVAVPLSELFNNLHPKHVKGIVIKPAS